jgi:hypothetical protein
MKTARFAAFSALVFLAVTSVVGAVPMLLNPYGEPWGMPRDLLQHSPFDSYLAPGMVLLLANGLLSVWTLWLMLRKRPEYPRWVTAQGCVLAGWLIGEMWMLRLVAWPHYFYGAVSLVLIVSGLALRADHEAKVTPEGVQDFVI